jgi:hypothetical protein
MLIAPTTAQADSKVTDLDHPATTSTRSCKARPTSAPTQTTRNEPPTCA